jgi:hypothetical protein
MEGHLMMRQLDGSHHQWFEKLAEKCCLMRLASGPYEAVNKLPAVRRTNRSLVGSRILFVRY